MRTNRARWIFRISGIYGLLAMAPLYFMEASVGRDYPPAITHPEYYYGFIGVTLAWQVAFLVISTDPRRYRLLMIPSIIEKVTFGVAVIVLQAQHRLPFPMLIAGCLDWLWAVLFVVAYRSSGGKSPDGGD